MNNVSYFDHRVIRSCRLSVDIATDWLPGRKNIHRPLCPSCKAMWQQGVPLVGRACNGELGFLGSFLALILAQVMALDELYGH